MIRLTTFIMVLMFLPTLTAEARPQRCGHRVEAAGVRHVTTFLARQSAREAWRRLVLAKYGREYANWEMAAYKRVRCESASPMTERCVVVARPCRF